MNLCRFNAEGAERLGIYSESEIREVMGNLSSPGKETGR